MSLVTAATRDFRRVPQRSEGRTIEVGFGVSNTDQFGAARHDMGRVCVGFSVETKACDGELVGLAASAVSGSGWLWNNKIRQVQHVGTEWLVK